MHNEHLESPRYIKNKAAREFFDNYQTYYTSAKEARLLTVFLSVPLSDLTQKTSVRLSAISFRKFTFTAW